MKLFDILLWLVWVLCASILMARCVGMQQARPSCECRCQCTEVE